MSGHSKWATIKHKKGAADAKRGKMFSKLAKEITIAAKTNGDPGSNPTLRTLVQKAKGINMPSDNIDKAIKKGTGEIVAEALEEITYEGYGPGGIGIVVNVLTENKNRAAAEVGHVFKRNNSERARGSVSRNFRAPRTDHRREPRRGGQAHGDLIEAAPTSVTTTRATRSSPPSPTRRGDGARKRQIPTVSSEIAFLPMTQKEVADLAKVKALLKFVEALEDNGDVQNVYHDADISDELMAQAEE